jgi:hypothetical protein
MGEGGARDGPPQIKTLPAGRAALVGILGDVRVGRHLYLITSNPHAEPVECHGQQKLPAGLRDSRNQAVQSMFAEGHTRHFEAPDEGTTTAGHTAAVYEASRARVSWNE